MAEFHLKWTWVLFLYTDSVEFVNAIVDKKGLSFRRSFIFEVISGFISMRYLPENHKWSEKMYCCYVIISIIFFYILEMIGLFWTHFLQIVQELS